MSAGFTCRMQSKIQELPHYKVPQRTVVGVGVGNDNPESLSLYLGKKMSGS